MYTPEHLETLSKVKAIRDHDLTDREKLLYDFLTFDWTYDYSDDIHVWRNANNRWKKLCDEANEKLSVDEAKIVTNLHAGNAVEKLRELFPLVEFVRYRNQQTYGLLAALEQGVPESDLKKALELRKMLAAIAEYPTMKWCYNRIIHTTHSPQHNVLRDKAAATEDEKYFGYNPGEVVHEMINRVVPFVRDSDYKYIKLLNKFGHDIKEAAGLRAGLWKDDQFVNKLLLEVYYKQVLFLIYV